MWFSSIHMPKIRLLHNSPKHRSKTNSKFKSNKWQKFYGSRAWHNLRETKLLEQPICERCIENDIVRPATEVHHKKVFGSCPTEEEQWRWFLDENNLISLCHECHQYIHNHYDMKYIEHWPFISELEE